MSTWHNYIGSNPPWPKHRDAWETSPKKLGEQYNFFAAIILIVYISVYYLYNVLFLNIFVVFSEINIFSLSINS